MTTTALTPETLPVTISHLARWIDWTDKANPQFKFKLNLTCDGRAMTTDYSGGILAFIDWDSPKVKQAFKDAVAKNRFGFSRLSKSIELVRCGRMSRRTVADVNEYNAAVEWIFAQSTVKAAQVCYSLVSDSQAGEYSFDEFCDSFGYDNDSRKAHSVWEACQKAGKDFRALVGDQFDAIATALEDY